MGHGGGAQGAGLRLLGNRRKEAGCISWGSGLGAFLLVLRPPWGSSPFASPPQYDELPHYPGIVDGPEALAGFSEAAPPTPRASGPYGPHRPAQPPRPGLDSEGLKQKDEIYG